MAPFPATDPTQINITHLSDLTPACADRAWLTAPHPTLPIVATCSADKTVRVYSLTSFKLLSTISGGHKRSVRSCAWKPRVQGESVLATASFDATVGIWRRWDSYGRETGHRPKLTGGEDEGVEDREQEEGKRGGREQGRHGGFEDGSDGDGRYDDDEDDDEWRFAVILDGHDSEVKSLSWSPSGMFLATCSRDKSIWVWEDLDDGDNNFETVAVMQEHEGDVKCVAWHPVEECLASASYDDTIRFWREDMDDWCQVACVRGHSGTVWFIDWEAVDTAPSAPRDVSSADQLQQRRRWNEQNALSGPRLVSCSDDRTVRVWRRQPNDSRRQQRDASAVAMPSIIRPTGMDEIWSEDAVLPAVHELSVYCVAWSKMTGRIASVGADSRVVVYEERVLPGDQGVATHAPDLSDVDSAPSLRTEWNVLASVASAHGIYEINHVVWAKRADRGKQAGEDEEVLITTADDGSVKVWTLTC